MNTEELSFFNRQLAGMIQSGIPLEGALAELGRTMARGKLKNEVNLLEKDLAGGTPLDQAMARRRFPDIYRTIMQAASKGRNLPGFLILLADYYHRTGELNRRLQGLMVYPLMVLICSFGLAAWMGKTYSTLGQSLQGSHPPPRFGAPRNSQGFTLGILPEDMSYVRQAFELWGPPVMMLVLIGLIVAAISIPGIRRWLQWRMPAFKEGKLTQFADSMALLLGGGIPLPESLALMSLMERNTACAMDISRWENRLAEGHGKFSDMTSGSRVFPPLFIWIVAAEGDDPGKGFARAAEIYRERAVYRSELLLQAALPAMVLLLGLMVMAQVLPWMGALQSRIAEFLTGLKMN